MNLQRIGGLLVCILFASHATVVQGDSDTVGTAAVQGLCMEVMSSRDGAPLTVSNVVVYAIHLSTNGDAVVYIPKREFFCRIALTDSNGVAISKTNLGKKYGSLFDALKEFSSKTIEMRSRPGQLEVMRHFPVRSGAAVGQNFHRLTDLFRVNRPGTYTFKIEMQVFKGTEDKTGRHYDLVRFPELALKVVKPRDDAPAFATPLNRPLMWCGTVLLGLACWFAIRKRRILRRHSGSKGEA